MEDETYITYNPKKDVIIPEITPDMKIVDRFAISEETARALRMDLISPPTKLNFDLDVIDIFTINKKEYEGKKVRDALSKLIEFIESKGKESL